jgi:hypothetical protein
MGLYEMLADKPRIGPPEPTEATVTRSGRHETETRVVETGDEDRGGLLLNQIIP